MRTYNVTLRFFKNPPRDNYAQSLRIGNKNSSLFSQGQD